MERRYSVVVDGALARDKDVDKEEEENDFSPKRNIETEQND